MFRLGAQHLARPLAARQLIQPSRFNTVQSRQFSHTALRTMPQATRQNNWSTASALAAFATTGATAYGMSNKALCKEQNNQPTYNEQATSDLFDAVYKNNVNAARSALNEGADINKLLDTVEKNITHQLSPLIMAAILGHTEITRLLIEHGADYNQQNDRGHTALILAIHYKNTSIADLLIRAGADLDLQDEKGNTALMFAAVRDQDKKPLITHLLLEHKADPLIENNSGRIASEIAKKFNNKNIMRLLEKHEIYE
jgi:ankyrin repeat protein